MYDKTGTTILVLLEPRNPSGFAQADGNGVTALEVTRRGSPTPDGIRDRRAWRALARRKMQQLARRLYGLVKCAKGQRRTVAGLQC